MEEPASDSQAPLLLLPHAPSAGFSVFPMTKSVRTFSGPVSLGTSWVACGKKLAMATATAGQLSTMKNDQDLAS